MAGGASNISRRAEFGGAVASPSTRRGALTPDEIRRGREWRRLGAGWDAIGKMLGCAGPDVREALADAPPPCRSPLPAPPPVELGLPPAPPPPRVGRPRPPKVRAGSYELASLRALIDDAGDAGGLTGGQVAALIGRPQVAALAMLGILARKGFASREAAEEGPCWRRPKFLWRATDAGKVEAARHRGRP